MAAGCLTGEHEVLDRGGVGRAVRRNRSGRQGGLFGRSMSHRLPRDVVLHRATLLPEMPRMLVTAYYELRMPLKELAMLHKVTPVQLRRIILHWKDVLSDADFLLAARYGSQLPGEWAGLAEAYFIQGKSLRRLAEMRGTTVHQVRRQLGEARLELVKAAAREQMGMGEGPGE